MNKQKDHAMTIIEQLLTQKQLDHLKAKYRREVTEQLHFAVQYQGKDPLDAMEELFAEQQLHWTWSKTA